MMEPEITFDEFMAGRLATLYRTAYLLVAGTLLVHGPITWAPGLPIALELLVVGTALAVRRKAGSDGG